MTPAFASWHDFFAMGGYGFFVWLAVAVTLISLLALILHTRFEYKRLLSDIRRRKARQARIEIAKDNQGATL